MTEVRVNKRGVQDTGEVGDRRSDARMNVAMEMVTALTTIAAETTCAIIFEPMVMNENGQQRRRSKAMANVLVWRSRMEPAAQQQAGEVAQLHRTITKMVIMLNAQTELQQAQWQGIETRLEKSEAKWDT
jgi:hypothetical protein